MRFRSFYYFSKLCFIIDSFQLLFVEKTEEEKQKEVEMYRRLKKRKNELEEKLLAKLDELRELCIKEAVNTYKPAIYATYEFFHCRTSNYHFFIGNHG